MSEVRNSCSFSLFPGYDIGVFVLPVSRNGVQIQNNDEIRNGVSAPAFLYHNDNATPVAIKPLMPYTYNGEWPTTCHLNGTPLRHLTFISNRKFASVTMCLETISASGVPSEEGVGDDDSNAEQTNPTTNKLLLDNFTVVYVVSGAINVRISADEEDQLVVREGETFVCERDDDSTPTDLRMAPINATDKPKQPHSKLKAAGLGIFPYEDSADAAILIIQVEMKPLERQGSSFISNASFLTNEPASINTGKNGINEPAKTARQSRGRTGSIIVYDDQPLWTVPKEMERMASGSELGSPKPAPPANLVTKHFDSAHQYRPPVFSARYQNESDVPPPVERDTLIIEEFPKGEIRTALINMVKNGLSEWIRIPVIVARGVEPGPVVGITAVVHGNELNGVPCIHRVITDIDVRKLKGTVVAVPCVNVPGYLRFSREFSDGRDLNRLFPGQEHGTASQVYNHNFFIKIANRFNYLIDLHTASFGRVNSYYVRSDMNDAVSSVLARLQQPQIILHNSGQDGTLRSAASARGIKAITVEIGNPQLFQNQYVQWSYMGVMRILAYLNMFNSSDSDDETAENVTPNTIMCSKGFWIYTKTGGVLEVYPNVNSIIRKGDLIARIKNIFGNIVDEIYAPSSGVTIGRSSNPVAMAGDRVMHLGIIRKDNEVLPKEAKENY